MVTVTKSIYKDSMYIFKTLYICQQFTTISKQCKTNRGIHRLGILDTNWETMWNFISIITNLFVIF